MSAEFTGQPRALMGTCGAFLASCHAWLTSIETSKTFGASLAVGIAECSLQWSTSNLVDQWMIYEQCFRLKVSIHLRKARVCDCLRNRFSKNAIFTREFGCAVYQFASKCQMVAYERELWSWLIFKLDWHGICANKVSRKHQQPCPTLQDKRDKWHVTTKALELADSARQSKAFVSLPVV